ncbi:MAG TPA: tyrosine-type recombinase/integrase [Acidimicrobiia bacterium]
MAEWQALAIQYVAGRVRRGEITPLTGRNTRSSLGSLVKEIGDRRTITPHTIEKWMGTRAHLSAATRRHDFIAARAWCDWLVQEGKLKSNPTVRFRAPKEPRRAPRALSAESVAEVLHVCPDERSKAIVWLMVGMGLRCCEVATLNIEDWDRHSDLLRVTGKGQHVRELPMLPHVSEAIRVYLSAHPATDGPLFRSYRNPTQAIRADTISGMVSELMMAAGIKHHPRDGVSAHALRHTAASDVLEHSHDLPAVQEMLGHRNLSTTSIYLRRASMERMRDSMSGRDYDPAA